MEDSGQFMTLFFMTIDSIHMQAQWVRAGHEPAIFYDPHTDSLEDLGGAGISLGIDQNWDYQQYRMTALKKGQIILLYTDGIREAVNRRGDMFGKERICDIMRKNSSSSAGNILDKMLADLDGFRQGAPLEDDIILVVIKVR